MRCDLRHVECTCEPTECRAAKPKDKEAPIRFSVRDQLMVCAFVGIVFGFIFYAAGSMAENHYRIQALDNQEQVATWKR